MKNNLFNTMHYLPSVVYLKFNNEQYHLSHGAFDPRYSGIYDKDKLKEFLKSTKTFDFIGYDTAQNSSKKKENYGYSGLPYKNAS